MPAKVLQYLLITISIMITGVHAQPAAASKPGGVKKVAAFKPPPVKTLLGRNAQTAEVTVDEARQLINLPLRVTDDKSNVYSISSYQFLYKKKSSIENEETGSAKLCSAMWPIFSEHLRYRPFGAATLEKAYKKEKNSIFLTSLPQIDPAENFLHLK